MQCRRCLLAFLRVLLTAERVSRRAGFLQAANTGGLEASGSHVAGTPIAAPHDDIVGEAGILKTAFDHARRALRIGLVGAVASSASGTSDLMTAAQNKDVVVDRKIVYPRAALNRKCRARSERGYVFDANVRDRRGKRHHQSK